MSSEPAVPGDGRKLLAYNLRRLRLLNGWSQEALAAEAGLHRTFVAHVERGARNISIDNIERLARALSAPVAELLQPVKGKQQSPSPMEPAGS